VSPLPRGSFGEVTCYQLPTPTMSWLAGLRTDACSARQALVRCACSSPPSLTFLHSLLVARPSFPTERRHLCPPSLERTQYSRRPLLRNVGRGWQVQPQRPLAPQTGASARGSLLPFAGSDSPSSPSLESIRPGEPADAWEWPSERALRGGRGARCRLAGVFVEIAEASVGSRAHRGAKVPGPMSQSQTQPVDVPRACLLLAALVSASTAYSQRDSLIANNSTSVSCQ
jgi:hypothetical protein